MLKLNMTKSINRSIRNASY